MRGTLFLVCGASGVGKTTIYKQVLKRVLNLVKLPTATTRKPREGEVDGKDYFFMEIAEFESLIVHDGLMEWAEVYGNYYGILKDEVQKKLEQGISVLLDIDIQGFDYIYREQEYDFVSIFIMAPSMEILESRLRGRGSETEESIAKRLKVAQEIQHRRGDFHYAFFNRDLKNSVDLFENIILEETNGKET